MEIIRNGYCLNLSYNFPLSRIDFGSHSINTIGKFITFEYKLGKHLFGKIMVKREKSL